MMVTLLSCGTNQKISVCEIIGTYGVFVFEFTGELCVSW